MTGAANRGVRGACRKDGRGERESEENTDHDCLLNVGGQSGGTRLRARAIASAPGQAGAAAFDCGKIHGVLQTVLVRNVKTRLHARDLIDGNGSVAPNDVVVQTRRFDVAMARLKEDLHAG